MNKLTKYLAVSGAVVGFGIGAAWAAETPEQKARDQKPVEKTATKTKTAAKSDLRAEIASPITGGFSAGARMSWGMVPGVGGYHGNGFLSPTGQPSGTPGNPGSY